MKSKAIVCAIAAASLGFASLSFAQGYDGRGPRGEARLGISNNTAGPFMHLPKVQPGPARL
jgi:hypothetical protein